MNIKACNVAMLRTNLVSSLIAVLTVGALALSAALGYRE